MTAALGSISTGLGRAVLAAAMGLGLALGAGACEDGGGGDGDDGLTECTEIGCNSSFTLTLAHSLPRDGDGHQITFTTPTHDVRCSIPAGDPGSSSCFGFAFADVAWNDDSIELTLIEPFVTTEDNPEGLPFESVDVTVRRSGATVAEFTVAFDPGDPFLPNGEGCPPVCWQVEASGQIPEG